MIKRLQEKLEDYRCPGCGATFQPLPVPPIIGVITHKPGCKTPMEIPK